MVLLVFWASLGDSKSGKFKIWEIQNLGNSKSGKLQIRESLNQESSKSEKLKIREAKNQETQNLGNSTYKYQTYGHYRPKSGTWLNMKKKNKKRNTSNFDMLAPQQLKNTVESDQT